VKDWIRRTTNLVAVDGGDVADCAFLSSRVGWVRVQKTMQAVKIRRTGNSNAVSLSKDFEELGYVVGAVVVIAAMPSGELRILRQDQIGKLIREMDGNGPGQE
jgi:hypothetical protein